MCYPIEKSEEQKIQNKNFEYNKIKQNDMDLLSVRAKKVLKCLNIQNMKELITYYKKVGCFNNTKNCGKKTNIELISLCKQNINNYSLTNSTLGELNQEDVRIQLKQITLLLEENQSFFDTKIICTKKYDCGYINTIYQNISISDLKLSNRDLIYAKQNNFSNLFELLESYDKNKFCFETSIVLKNIFIFYTAYKNIMSSLLNSNYIENIIQTIQLEDANLPERAYNCCISVKINNIFQLLEYYSNKKSFKNIQHSGIKTDKILCNLCDIYIYHCSLLDNYLIYQNSTNISTIFKQDEKTNEFNYDKDELSLKNFNYQQKYTFLKFTNVFFSTEYNNNLHYIYTKLRKKWTFYELIMLIQVQHSKIIDIYNNIGIDYNIIITIIRKCLNIFIKVKQNKITNYHINLFQFLQLFKSMYTKELFSDIKENYLNNLKNQANFKNFPIFNFFEYYKSTFNLLKDDRADDIYFNRKSYYNNIVKSSLDKLGEKYGITRERTRQISILGSNDIKFNNFFFEHNKLIKFTQYKKYKSVDLININDSFSSKINNIEDVFFSSIFYTDVFSVLLIETHNCVYQQNNMNIFIKKTFLNYFDFGKFILDLYYRINDNIQETYKLPIRKIYEKYRTDDILNFSNAKKVIFLIKKIINEIIKIEILGKDLLFQRNTKFKSYEYPLEILRKISRPLKLDEIVIYCKNNYPKIQFFKESVRSIMTNSDLFISFGKTSTYGLKEWGYDIVKSGQVLDLVEYYLDQKSHPVHISELEDYIRENRNLDNVLRVLKLDKKNRFTFYPNYFIGLRKKDYSLLKLKYKGVPPRLFHYVSELFAANENKCSYTEFLCFFSKKYKLSLEQFKLFFDKEITFKSIVKDNNIEIRLNLDSNNIDPRSFMFNKNLYDESNLYLDSKLLHIIKTIVMSNKSISIESIHSQLSEYDISERMLKLILNKINGILKNNLNEYFWLFSMISEIDYKKLLLAIQIILFKTPQSNYYIAQKVSNIGLKNTISNTLLFNILANHPNFTSENNLWRSIYCHYSLKKYCEITDSIIHSFTNTKKVYEIASTILASNDVNYYIESDYRFYENNRTLLQPNEVLDNIMEEFDF